MPEFLIVEEVSDEELSEIGAVKNDTSPRHRYKTTGFIDLPELEVIALTKRLGGVALVEDGAARRLARRLGVPLLTVAEVLVALPINHIEAAQKILDTGYMTYGLKDLAKGKVQ